MLIENIRIEKVTFKGYGLGFWNNQAVFVPYGLPGDILDVEEEYRKKDVIFGKIVRIISPSEFRKNADCEVFGICGGCDWLHVTYENQRLFKNAISQEIFRNIPNIKKILRPIIPSPNENYYRNKSLLPITLSHNNPIIGMFKRNSHQVIGHTHCKIQPKIYDKIATVLQTYIVGSRVKVYNEETNTGTIRHLGIRYSEATNEIIVVLVTKTRKLPFTKVLVKQLLEAVPAIVGVVQNINPNPINTILGEDEKILYGRPYILEKMEKFIFKVNYRSFLQINSKQALKMYRFARSFIQDKEKVIDAFSGTGTIGIFVSPRAKQVYCVERNEAAGTDAIENGKRNRVKNCEFITDQVETAVPKLCKEKDIDTIIFDPPRRGLESQTITTVIQEKIKKIIYISCNPTTQVRDLKQFLEAGYEIEIIQPFDMFPHTYHIESIVVLRLNDK